MLSLSIMSRIALQIYRKTAEPLNDYNRSIYDEILNLCKLNSAGGFGLCTRNIVIFVIFTRNIPELLLFADLHMHLQYMIGHLGFELNRALYDNLVNL